MSVDLPPMREDGLLCLEPEQVLRFGKTECGSKLFTEVLVKWHHLPKEEATWEDLKKLSLSFPQFQVNLEDKVLLEGTSIDRIIEAIDGSGDAEVARRRPHKPKRKYLSLGSRLTDFMIWFQFV